SKWAFSGVTCWRTSPSSVNKVVPQRRTGIVKAAYRYLGETIAIGGHAAAILGNVGAANCYFLRPAPLNRTRSGWIPARRLRDLDCRVFRRAGIWDQMRITPVNTFVAQRCGGRHPVA